MSETTNLGGTLFEACLLMFVIIKVVGTNFAGWSWFWVLLPIVPDLVLILRKAGLL